MGEVYRVIDTRLERDVAVKILPAHLAEDDDGLARFERETKAVAALSHPNILTIYDVGRYEGVPFAVTDLLEGTSYNVGPSPHLGDRSPAARPKLRATRFVLRSDPLLREGGGAR